MSDGGSGGAMSAASDAALEEDAGHSDVHDAGTDAGRAMPTFFIGADLSEQGAAPPAVQDDLLAQMKAHGFNYVRLRTFVDPHASDGYDKVDGSCDIEHTVAFGSKVKSAGMGLLLDFHYSDNWADPGKQCIPIAWQQPDAFSESCYQKYQGDPSSVANTMQGWTGTFTQLAQAYPSILLFAAEYGPLQREINDVLFALPNQQGTFNWQPTTNGDWNEDVEDPSQHHSLLLRSGATYELQPDLALYDQMQRDYTSRL